MIELRNVSKRYETGTHALSDVSFKIEDGEFVFIMGPSGAGKSTLVKLLDGEEVPTSGKVIVSGVDVGRLKKSKVYLYRRKIGVVFQDFKLLPKKTVFENIAYALEILDMPTDKIRKRVRDVLKLVDLSDKTNALPKELSGGQQQRVAIARSVVKKPMIIIADEPTGNLDPELTNEMIGLLERINKEEKTTIIVVTHNISTVEAHPKRTIRIENGHVVSDSVYKPTHNTAQNKTQETVVESGSNGTIFAGVNNDEDDTIATSKVKHEISLEPDHKVESKIDYELDEDIDPDDDAGIRFEDEKVEETIVEEQPINPIVNDATPVFDNYMDDTVASKGEVDTAQEVITENTQPVSGQDVLFDDFTEQIPAIKQESETIIDETLEDDFTEQIPTIRQETESLENDGLDDDFTEQIEIIKNDNADSHREEPENDFTEQFSPIKDDALNKELDENDYVIEDFTGTTHVVSDDTVDVLQSALDEMNETIEMFKRNNKE